MKPKIQRRLAHKQRKAKAKAKAEHKNNYCSWIDREKTHFIMKIKNK